MKLVFVVMIKTEKPQTTHRGNFRGNVILSLVYGAIVKGGGGGFQTEEEEGGGGTA